MDTAAACLAMSVFVFLKAFQQRNVAFDHHTLVLPISILMALCEFYVIAWVVTTGFVFWKIVLIGCCTGMATLSAMYLHRRFL